MSTEDKNETQESHQDDKQLQDVLTQPPTPTEIQKPIDPNQPQPPSKTQIKFYKKKVFIIGVSILLLVIFGSVGYFISSNKSDKSSDKESQVSYVDTDQSTPKEEKPISEAPESKTGNNAEEPAPVCDSIKQNGGYTEFKELGVKVPSSLLGDMGFCVKYNSYKEESKQPPYSVSFYSTKEQNKLKQCNASEASQSVDNYYGNVSVGKGNGRYNDYSEDEQYMLGFFELIKQYEGFFISYSYGKGGYNNSKACNDFYEESQKVQDKVVVAFKKSEIIK